MGKEIIMRAGIRSHQFRIQPNRLHPTPQRHDNHILVDTGTMQTACPVRCLGLLKRTAKNRQT